jgi:hypothetical protein
MPIPVTCQCGQSFAAGDHLAGRTVQCPKCKNPLVIPAPQAMAAAPSQMAAAMPSAGGANIFDNAGIKARAQGVPTCPSCSAELAPNAVLCVKCGYHLQKGQRIGSLPMTGAGGGHDGHGSVAAAALARAAQTIDEDKENTKKQYKEGMPWWAIAGIFIFAVSFLGMMLALPGKTAIMYGGLTINTVCWLFQMYYGIRILMLAFEDGVVHGLLCLCTCGIYSLIYVFMHWDKCASYFLWSVIMWFGSMIGAGMFYGSAFIPDEEKKETRLLFAPHTITCILPGNEIPASVVAAPFHA